MFPWLIELFKDAYRDISTMKFIKLTAAVPEMSDSLTLDREEENVPALGESGFTLSSIGGRPSTNEEA